MDSSLMKLVLLVDLVLHVAHLQEVLDLDESDEHHEEDHVEREPLKRVLADPVELDGLEVAVKLEHSVLQFG